MKVCCHRPPAKTSGRPGRRLCVNWGGRCNTNLFSHALRLAGQCDSTIRGIVYALSHAAARHPGFPSAVEIRSARGLPHGR